MNYCWTLAGFPTNRLNINSDRITPSSVKHWKRMARGRSGAKKSVHALTGSRFSLQVCELVRFLIENCCSVLGEDVTSLFRSFSQKSSSSDHGSGKSWEREGIKRGEKQMMNKITPLVTDSCLKCPVKTGEADLGQQTPLRIVNSCQCGSWSRSSV